MSKKFVIYTKKDLVLTMTKKTNHKVVIVITQENIEELLFKFEI